MDDIFNIGDTIYYIRGYEVLTGTLKGINKKGTLKVTKGNSPKKIHLVNVLKAFKTKEKAMDRLSKKIEHKKSKEQYLNDKFGKIIDIEDDLFRAYKSLLRKEISEGEYYKIEKKCKKELRILERYM